MKIIIKKNKDSLGFSLIELLVYIAIVGIVITGAVIFTFDMSYAREKAYKQQIVEQNARIAMSKIIQEIRKAKTIQNISANQLILNNGTYTTTIEVLSGTLQITSNGNGPYSLTSNQVAVFEYPTATQPIFKNLSSSDNKTKNIAVSLTIRQKQLGTSAHQQAETSIKDSIELNNQFNYASSLLVNGTNALLLNPYLDITGITLGNSSSSALTIDKMKVSWSNVTGTPTLNQVRINNIDVWTGTTASGSEINITDIAVPAGSGTIPVNYVRFSGSMAGGIIVIEFIMSDSSVKRITLDFS